MASICTSRGSARGRAWTDRFPPLQAGSYSVEVTRHTAKQRQRVDQLCPDGICHAVHLDACAEQVSSGVLRFLDDVELRVYHPQGSLQGDDCAEDTGKVGFERQPEVNSSRKRSSRSLADTGIPGASRVTRKRARARFRNSWRVTSRTVRDAADCVREHPRIAIPERDEEARRC